MITKQDRGLYHEEPVIFEHQASTEAGWDIPIPPEFTLRTGEQARGEIGLKSSSEPEVVRHYVRLSQLNYAIDVNIYPLGSCTMKHNPRINERVARLPGMAHIHPYQELSTVAGACEVIVELQRWLAELSGLPAVSLNPAAGAHGEFTGLLVIRKYHESQGNPRKIVLVPDSAHGTNPATATMCGYKAHNIKSCADGTVDLQSLKQALEEFKEETAALMITNPNTCGKFEKNIIEICALMHQYGAKVYCDGANFNAIVGKVRPGDLGVDVMHFNLHKTFSTPHGGGGPGSGPIAVSEELRKHLPIPFIRKKAEDEFEVVTEEAQSVGYIKSFYGHFGMFVRALAYMMSHGRDGLKQVAEDAVLNANYVLNGIKDTYHVPFTGVCMHECLVTDQIQNKGANVTTLDIAKTMIEYGVHPMTIYFPLVVSGAMLIEPTETETKESLDNLIELLNYIGKNGSSMTDSFKANPVSTPRKKLDEVGAARNPVLTYQEENSKE
jgi:glycine dehydrogenase subunit 2